MLLVRERSCDGSAARAYMTEGGLDAVSVRERSSRLFSVEDGLDGERAHFLFRDGVLRSGEVLQLSLVVE